MPDWWIVIMWAIAGAVIGAGLSYATGCSVRTTTVLSTRRGPTTAIGVAVTAILFGALAWRLDTRFELLPYSTLAAISVPLAMIDTIEHRLPNKVLLVTYPVLLILFSLGSILHSDPTSLLRALTSMIAIASFYLTLALSFPDGLGAGDVKLGGLLGLVLGWTSWTALITGTLLGWLLGAGAWFTLRLTGHMTRDSLLPLGPFLLLGTLITIAVMPPP
jgi:leader peptidase (prepilin peptidase) / N-methyltransferase